MTANPNRPRWEVGDVFRRFGSSYVAERGLPSSHLRVMNHIATCRTAALGGHMEACDSCGHERPVYNSCRDRHCPKCQTMTKEKWLAARKAELLPVDYYHKVFTLPHELNGLVLANRRVIISLLFRSVAETLLQFGRDPRSRLGGKVGFTLVLHTWNQQLHDHFHIHCVIPAGALSPDGSSWISAKSDRFLFSVKALSAVFRAKFLGHLRSAYDSGKLIFSGSLGVVADPQAFADLLASLGGKKWVVYSKAPFGGPERVLDYLGRYTHRVAISNHLLVNITERDVTFAYRDRKDGSRTKTQTVTGHEFIRRFLLHVLPPGFTRIRHYGLLASRNKAENLAACRIALGTEPPPPLPKASSPTERLLELTGIDVLKCRVCAAGRMHRRHSLPDLGASLLSYLPVCNSS